MRFYLTTAIDYVNGRPHLGQAYEKVLADVIARYKRLSGVDTVFIVTNGRRRSAWSWFMRLGCSERPQKPLSSSALRIACAESFRNRAWRTRAIGYPSRALIARGRDAARMR